MLHGMEIFKYEIGTSICRKKVMEFTFNRQTADNSYELI